MAEGTQNMNIRHGRGRACHQDWWRKGGLINRALGAVCLLWVTIMSVYNIPTHKVVPNNWQIYPKRTRRVNLKPWNTEHIRCVALAVRQKLIRFCMLLSRMCGHPKDSPQKMKINGTDWEVLFLAHRMNNPLQHVWGLAFQVGEGKYRLQDKDE